MDAASGSGSKSHVWPILGDNGIVNMNATMDNLEDKISNLEKVFTGLKNKKMLQRKENKPNKGAHVKVGTQAVGCVSQPDWPTIIVINHYQAQQITAGQSGCDTQPDVPTLAYSRLDSRKSTMNNSFTLGSSEEVDNVKILQSCNGLLLCIGSVWPVFIRSVVLRMAIYPRKSLDYKVMQAGRTSCDIDI
ncbi:hypothetical protein Tco_0481827 [Tanacetum coccineum]